jgi:hypothetical protein
MPALRYGTKPKKFKHDSGAFSLTLKDITLIKRAIEVRITLLKIESIDNPMAITRHEIAMYKTVLSKLPALRKALK